MVGNCPALGGRAAGKGLAQSLGKLAHVALVEFLPTLRCSLTGKTVETCCCVHKEGKLRCTLADKDVESCCCMPETDATDETDKTGNEEPKE